MQNSYFWQFWDVPCCHGNRKFKIKHAVTEAIVQSAFVPIFTCIEAFFIAVWTCNFSMFELVTFQLKRPFFTICSCSKGLRNHFHLRYLSHVPKSRICIISERNLKIRKLISFLLACPKYREHRNKYLKPYFCRWPTINKFELIMNSKS
jgi:hypothetical protein